MTDSAGPSCQVVPDIPSFSVDDGFRYRVPPQLDVTIGTRVRVPVGGRRRRGYVTHVFDPADVPDRPLADIDGVVGTVPSFGHEDLSWLRWCAAHYVAPLSVILGRTVPANVPRSSVEPPPRRPGSGHRIEAITPGTDPIADIAARVEVTDGSVLVVAPTIAEVGEIAERLHVTGRDTVVAHSELSSKETTAAWVTAATQPGTVLIGTREVAMWPIPDLASVIIVEDARRAMRSPATPTISVRDVVLRRAESAQIPVSVIAPVPSLEVLARRPRVSSPPGRSWPLVEVADRNEEPPGPSVLLDRTRQAIVGAAGSGPVFVLVPRRGYAAAFRCAACGALRRCVACGAAVTGQEACGRCGTPVGACVACGGRSWRALGAGIGVVVDDLARSLGDRVRGPDGNAPVTVGTERDLVGRTGMALAVAVDVDGAALAPTYRAGEDALRLFVRLARTVERGRGRRCLVQTSDRDQDLVRALVHGRPEEFLEREAAARRRSGFPPYGELLALEVQHDDEDFELPDLAHAFGGEANVLGPARERDRWRWLVTGRDLTSVRARLRAIVSSLRSAGARVRVDVDAIDL